MTRNEYWNMMNILYLQLHKVEDMTEEEACKFMDSSSKAEGLRMVKDIMDAYRRLAINQKLI